MKSWFGRDGPAARLAGSLPGIWLVSLVFLLSLTLTLTAWYIIRRQHDEDASIRFDRQRDHVADAIRHRMLAYEHVLRGTQGLFAASGRVNRDEFRTYVTNLRIERYYPGIQGIGFSQVVAPRAVSKHIQQLRDAGLTNYAVWPQGKRSVYTAIVYLEPVDWRNRLAVGYDMFSEPVRRAAMARARDTGQPAITGKVTLVQETDKDTQAGFLMYLPVYRHGANINNVAQRQAGLAGFVYSPFRTGDFMHGVLDENAPLAGLRIYNGKGTAQADLMYDSRARAAHDNRNPQASFKRLTTVTIGGHTWTLVLNSTPAFNASVYDQRPLIVLSTGLFIGLIMSGAAWRTGSSRDRAIALADRMTAELRVTKESVEDTNLELATINQELRREQKEREKAHRLLSAVLENIEAGVVACDNQGVLTLFNRATRELHGLPEAPLPAARWAEHYQLFLPDGVTPMATSEVPLFRALQGERVRNEEMNIGSRSDGPMRTLLASGQVMYDADGVKLGAVVAMHDITERKQLECKLRTHAQALEQKNRELQDFAYVASHDLQEPLRKIQAFGDLVISSEGERLSDTGRDYLARMRKSASRMRALIDDLLTLSRVGSQGQPFTKVDLDRVAREVLSDLETLIRETGTRIDIAMLPAIEADPTQMRQLLQNLIGNALKFRRQGATPHIQIFARRMTKAQQNGHQGELTGWRVFVEDNGIGFETKYLDRIFAPFQRLHSRDAYEGTGMGLAICQRIITRHGGEITAESEPGKGAVFSFTLAVRRTDIGAEPADDSRIADPLKRALS